MATIQIDKTEYGLEDCKVGEQLDLSGEVTAIDGNLLTIEVADVNYGEAAEEEAAPAKSSKGPPRAIVAIGIPATGKSKGY